jgi:hypothetical protein
MIMLSIRKIPSKDQIVEFLTLDIPLLVIIVLVVIPLLVGSPFLVAVSLLAVIIIFSVSLDNTLTHTRNY